MDRTDMSDDQNVAPAGDDASTTVTATMPEPLTVEAAASRLMGWDKADAEAEGTNQAQTSTDAEEGSGPADDASPEGEEGEEPNTDDGAEEEPAEGEDTEDAQAAQKVPDGIDWEKVPGDAKFRLRDGTVITGAEIKQRWDDLTTASKLRTDLERERAEFQSQRTQAAQQYQQFLPVAQQALRVLQESLPKVPNPPDPRLLQTDPLLYHEQNAIRAQAVEEYNAKVGRMRQISAEAERQRQAAEAEEKNRLSGYIQEQQKALFDAMPDLRDTAKRDAFQREFKDTGAKEYGFTEAELNEVYDHRIIKVFADAMAYRKLMKKGAPKPKPNAGAPAAAVNGKPAQSAPTPPVANGGKREGPADQKTARKSALFAEARKKGGLDMRAAAQLAAQLES